MEKLLNNFKIAFTKGDTYALAVKIKNITDDLGSAYFTVKENPEDEALIQKTLGAGVDKIDDRAYKNEKTYKIQLQSEDTAYLEPLVQYLYDFRVAVGNVVKTLLSGVFVVNHSISEVSTTITSTLEVAINDVIESELNIANATSGIEYENDPVACAKIGDMSKLNTTAKGTVVEAINEAVTKNTATQEQVNKILNGKTFVPKSNYAISATQSQISDTALIAEYASEDKTKGTIEQRLTALGFREGVVESLVATASENFLHRQGNYVIGKLVIDTSATAETLNVSAGTVIGVIPEEFRPKETENIRIKCSNYINVNEIKNYYYIELRLDINTDGTITVNQAYGNRFYIYNSTADMYKMMSISRSDISRLDIVFGYEANPIS